MIVAPQLSQTVASPDAVQHKQLVSAAHQFEAIFLEQMMKPFAGDKEGEGNADREDETAGSDTYKSMGVEAMTRAVSQAGGLGIATSVVASVERQAHSQNGSYGHESEKR